MAKKKIRYAWVGTGVVLCRDKKGNAFDILPGELLPEDIPLEFLNKHKKSKEIEKRDYTKVIDSDPETPESDKEEDNDNEGS